MLKALGFLFKISGFAVLVLVIGNTVKVGGRTISDQVMKQVYHAERSDAYESVRGWAGRLTEDARQGLVKKAKVPHRASTRPAETATSAMVTDQTRTTASAAVASNAPLSTASPGRSEESSAPQERIDSSERQKLKALIRELNSSHGRD